MRYPIEADAEVGLTYKDVVEFDKEELETFNSLKGYCKYQKDLNTLVDYFDSKKISEEQFEEATAHIKASKQAYRLL